MPELALNTIIIIVLILFPGLVVRRFYFSGDFSKQFVKGEWSERLVTSVFWGLFSQLISLLLFSYTSWAKFNDSNDIINNIFQDGVPNTLITDSNSILFLLGYIVFSLIFSGILGYLAHKLVRIFNLDIKNKAFRFSNNWHYYFKGEILKTEDYSKYKDLKILFTWIDIVIDTKNGNNKLIQGVLSQYTINNSTGDLEYIYLDDAKRWSNSEKRFKPVDSHIFVVPFVNVIDFNIRYNYTLKTKRIRTIIYGILFSIFSFFVFSSIFILPWFLAKPEVGVFRILISTITTLIFTTFFTSYFLPSRGDDKRRNFQKWTLKEQIIFWIITIFFFLATLILLGYGFDLLSFISIP